MKNYREMSADVFRRRDEWLRKRRQRNRILLRTGSVCGLCVLLVSAGLLVPAMTGKEKFDYSPSTTAPNRWHADAQLSDNTTADHDADDPEPGNTVNDPSDDQDSPAPAEPDIPQEPVGPPTHHIGFHSYDELNAALKNKESSIWQELKKDDSDYNEELFESLLSGFSDGELHLLIPMASDKKLELGDRYNYSYIELYTYEYYNMPWILYFCRYQGSYLNLGITYPQILNNPEIDPDGTYLDLLGVIAPKFANPEYYRDKGYAAYEQDLTLGDGRTVSAFVLEKDGGWRRYSFLYDGAMVAVWTDAKDLLREDFWSEFSMMEFD